MSSSFRFGLWVGFVAGVTFAALWHSKPEGEPELSVIVVEESVQEIDVTEITTSELPTD